MLQLGHWYWVDSSEPNSLVEVSCFQFDSSRPNSLVENSCLSFSKTLAAVQKHSALVCLFLMIFMEFTTTSHCPFSSNLFHGHLAQIYIDQLSDPENKKCSPWKVFGKNHPQILQLLSRRGPRSPEARLSQHYISPKMTFQLLKSGRIWGWFFPKTFQGLHFLFSVSLSWSMYIWAKCPWNKFDGKAQCE